MAGKQQRRARSVANLERRHREFVRKISGTVRVLEGEKEAALRSADDWRRLHETQRLRAERAEKPRLVFHPGLGRALPLKSFSDHDLVLAFARQVAHAGEPSTKHTDDGRIKADPLGRAAVYGEILAEIAARGLLTMNEHTVSAAPDRRG